MSCCPDSVRDVARFVVRLGVPVPVVDDFRTVRLRAAGAAVRRLVPAVLFRDEVFFRPDVAARAGVLRFLVVLLRRVALARAVEREPALARVPVFARLVRAVRVVVFRGIRSLR